MMRIPPNLRKAAVLIRSLDAETAQRMLAQLPAAEAAQVRAAMEAIGPLDPDECADIAAELRRGASNLAASHEEGVELALSQNADAPAAYPKFPSAAATYDDRPNWARSPRA